jgi:hypothetical protein
MSETMQEDEWMCGAFGAYFRCTLPAGHASFEHVATDENGDILDMWDRKSEE